MKKWLLVWNLVLTVVVMVLMFGGCSDSQITSLANQVNTNTANIQQLQATVSQQAQTIQAQSAQIAALQANANTALSLLTAQLPSIIEQYVKTYAATK